MSRVVNVIAACGVVLFLLALGSAPSTAATTQDVAIQNFAFQPASLTISVGDTVRWTNNDSAEHTTESSTDTWNSGALPTGQSFSFMFTTVGTYTYFCSFHPFMQGTITVSAETQPTSTPTQQKYTVDLPLMIK